MPEADVELHDGSLGFLPFCGLDPDVHDVMLYVCLESAVHSLSGGQAEQKISAS